MKCVSTTTLWNNNLGMICSKILPFQQLWRLDAIQVHVFMRAHYNYYHHFMLAAGEFKKTSATQFCMTVTGTNVNGIIFNDTTSAAKKYVKMH